MMTSRSRLCLLTLIFGLMLQAPLVARQQGPVLQLKVDSHAAEGELFDAFARQLSTHDRKSIAAIGEAASSVVEAFYGRDEEALVSAFAIYEFRLDHLSDKDLELIEDIEGEVYRQSRLAAMVGTPEKNIVGSGCEAELICRSTAQFPTVSCQCTGPYATCDYSGFSNSFGGNVDCNCVGVQFDRRSYCREAFPCTQEECDISQPGSTCTARGCSANP